jgi:hypothetical protein
MSLLPSFTRSIGFGTGWSQLVADSGEGAVLSIFDARIMNRAISESGGEATDIANLGTVHYTYDDMKNNDGLVTLPYG